MKITEERLYQLSYCGICKNRLFDIKVGLKCGLTKDLGNFEKFCPSYVLDKSELEQIQNKRDNQIEKSYPSRNSFNLVTGSYLNSKEEEKKTSFPKSRENKTEFSSGRLSSQVLFLISSAILVYLVLVNYEQISVENFQINKHYLFLVLPLTIGILYYFGFIDKSKAEIEFKEEFLLYNRRPSILHKIENEKIYWNEITNLRFWTIEDENGSFEKIIVGTLSRGVLEINISDLNTTPQEFIYLVKKRAKNVVQQRTELKNKLFHANFETKFSS